MREQENMDEHSGDSIGAPALSPAFRTRAGSAPLSVPVPFDRVHLVGVAGAGMKALAEWLADSGCCVSGSDTALTPDLRSHFSGHGISATARQGVENLSEPVSAVIHSAAVPDEHPELQEARRRGIRTLSYPEALGTLMRGRVGISVAGTHGKSSTTAMIASILEAAGRDPSVFCGAEAIGAARNGRGGSGPLVVESCEYRRHFLHLSPQVGVILNIEPDHFDCYATVDEMVEAYRQFAERIPRGGTLVLNRRSPEAPELARSCNGRIAWYSPEPATSGWSASMRNQSGGEVAFDLFHDGSRMGAVRWPHLGGHQIGNAAAAAAVCDVLDVPTDAILAGLESFTGLRRRLEVVGQFRGVTVIDDYAHHPTEIRATLRAVREAYGDRRIRCAFQPHQLSRTRALFDEFASAFADANDVLICPVFGAREVYGSEHVTVSRSLADEITRAGVPARFVPSLDHVSAALETDARPGDVFLVAGAGNIERVCHALSRRLQRNHAA